MQDLRDELEDVFRPEGPGDTVVEMLGVKDAERPFTHILRWLLDLTSEHGAGDAYLNAFVEQTELAVDANSVSVDSFASNLGDDNNEVDIVIHDRSKCIGVEIKTTHSENAEKLEAEFDAIQSAYDRDEHHLVYLTHDPESDPDVELADYSRLTWNELTELFDEDEAAEEWHGFLDHLFTHIDNNVMKDKIDSVKDLDGDIKKGEFYAYTEDFINEAKKSYWRVIRQFLKDISQEIEERNVENWDVQEKDEPWHDYQRTIRLNGKHDLDWGRGNPDELAVYMSGWPSAAMGDKEEETLTIRFSFNIRGINTSGTSTALTNREMVVPFGVEVNFDIFTNDHGQDQDKIRNAFFEHLGDDALESLRDAEYVDENSQEARYHVLGKILQQDWPPDEDILEETVNELDRLMNIVYEPIEVTLEELEQKSTSTPGEIFE